MTQPQRRLFAHGLYFEDLEVGTVYDAGSVRVTEEDVIAFARTWDPQPFHLDRDAGAKSIFGSITASGLHTIALTWRLQFDHGLLRHTAVAGLGFEHVRFHAAVRPDDNLSVSVTVKSKTEGRHFDRGTVLIGYETRNQDSKVVLSMDMVGLVRRRPRLTAPGQPSEDVH